jgi:hypothetical protein
VTKRAIRLAAMTVECWALAGCMEAIQMRNPATGQVATCGNHSLVFPIPRDHRVNA